jgi:hypothetical protein
VHTNGGGMAHFEVTVRLSDVNESDGPAARRAIEERLRAAGFSRWQIVGVGLQGATPKSMPQRRTNIEPRRREGQPDMSRAGGGLLVAAVVAWTLWFLWLLAG